LDDSPNLSLLLLKKKSLKTIAFCAEFAKITLPLDFWAARGAEEARI
jgi:hypothetical protein